MRVLLQHHVECIPGILNLDNSRNFPCLCCILLKVSICPSCRQLQRHPSSFQVCYGTVLQSIAPRHLPNLHHVYLSLSFLKNTTPTLRQPQESCHVSTHRTLKLEAPTQICKDTPSGLLVQLEAGEDMETAAVEHTR